MLSAIDEHTNYKPSELIIHDFLRGIDIKRSPNHTELDPARKLLEKKGRSFVEEVLPYGIKIVNREWRGRAKTFIALADYYWDEAVEEYRSHHDAKRQRREEEQKAAREQRENEYRRKWDAKRTMRWFQLSDEQQARYRQSAIDNAHPKTRSWLAKQTTNNSVSSFLNEMDKDTNPH